MELPMKDTWGVLMRRDSPLASQDTVSPTGPLGQAADPLPAGGQQERAVPLAAEGTFRAAHRSDL